jgi:transposase
MSLARLVVTAVVVEGRSKSEVAREYRVSRRWVQKLTARYDSEGEAGLEPRSRRPRSSPHKTPAELEEQIVGLRKTLAEEGLDAGAATIAFHLAARHGSAPAVSTIWRVLTRRGFVTPQPRKRPRSSYTRFQADQPNERWQLDITHWQLAGGAAAEILNIIDDHSRLLTASAALAVFKAADVVTVFRRAAAEHGLPASILERAKGIEPS